MPSPLNDGDLRFAYMAGLAAGIESVVSGEHSVDPEHESRTISQEWMDARYESWFKSFKQLKGLFG